MEQLAHEIYQLNIGITALVVHLKIYIKPRASAEGDSLQEGASEEEDAEQVDRADQVSTVNSDDSAADDTGVSSSSFVPCCCRPHCIVPLCVSHGMNNLLVKSLISSGMLTFAPSRHYITPSHMHMTLQQALALLLFTSLHYYSFCHVSTTKNTLVLSARSWH